MKQKIKVTKNDKTLYDGKILDLPFKEKYIIEKSIELFDDDDPCIIHKSYVIKEFADSLITTFKKEKNNTLDGADFKDKFDIVDFTEIDLLTFELKG